MTFDAKAFIKDLPQAPGVYLMLDATDSILYVGKARSLKKRVANYFSGQAKDTKTMKLVNAVVAMRYHLTHSESEALILENQLIKKHKPRYNVLLKDGKSYPYIYASVGEDAYPRIEFRRGQKGKKGRYFGPYPSAASVRQSLHFLQKVFKVRQCNNSTFANRSRPCLQHQINRCTAPCVGLVSEKDYQQQLQFTFDFINGQSGQVVAALVEKMEQAAQSMAFEKAAEIRDQIKAIRLIQSQQYVESDHQLNADVFYVGQQAGLYLATVGTVRNGQLLGFRNHTPKTPKGTTLAEFLTAFLGFYGDQHGLSNQLICNLQPTDKSELLTALSELKGYKITLISQPRGDKKKLLNLAAENNQNALNTRASRFATWQKKWALWTDELGLSKNPERVECFDISHHMGEHTRASCVVFTESGPDRSAFRQYIIEGITAGDDYAAMRQVLSKRLASIEKHDIGLPDVFLIDGGKGQVNQCTQLLKELNIDAITVIGVTKDANRTAGEERLFLPNEDRYIKPEAHGMLSLMVQNIRDEAHNHAIKSQRKAFKKSRNTSSLEGIPGIGAKRRDALLKYFGGLQGLMKASQEDICQVDGISEKMSQKLFAFLHPKS